MTLEARVTALAVRIAQEINTIRTERGLLADLTTTEKGSIVGALNELNGLIADLDAYQTALINDGITSSVKTWSSTKIGSEISAAISALVGGAPTVLDTLNELATAFQNNPDVITALQDNVATKVAFTAQTLTAPQQAQARTNIGAASAQSVTDLSTAIGDTDHNFVTDFTTTLT